MFKVTIKKIEQKIVHKQVWVDAVGPDDKAGYALKGVPETVETEIYQQTVEQLQLEDVILAVLGHRRADA